MSCRTAASFALLQGADLDDHVDLGSRPPGSRGASRAPCSPAGVAPSGKPTTEQTFTGAAAQLRGGQGTQIGLMQTAAKRYSRASAQSLRICARGRVGLQDRVVDVAGDVLGTGRGPTEPRPGGEDAARLGIFRDAGPRDRVAQKRCSSRAIRSRSSSDVRRSVPDGLGRRSARARAPVLDHGHAAQMPLLGALGRQEDVDDLLGQAGADQAGAEGQDVGVVVLAAVAGAREVVGQRGPHARDLVGDHGRADPGAVDHDRRDRTDPRRPPRPPPGRRPGSRPLHG